MKDDGQMTLEAAVAAKERVLDLVALNNDGFVTTMRKLAVEIARKHGTVTSDDLRVLADKYGIKPDHQNAWGAVFHRKKWLVLDRRLSLYPGNRGREIKVWGLR